MEITKKQLLENKKQINESLLSFENVLMGLGFVPIIGEVADFALIIYYLYKGEKLYAALMLIALFPVVGDMIIKPFIGLLKTVKGGSAALKSGTQLTSVVSKNPKLASQSSKIVEYAKSPKVEKAIKNLSDVKPGWGNSLGKAVSELINSLSNVKVVGALKSGAIKKASGGTFRSGLKDYFKGERIAKYASKKGISPEKVVNSWWLNYGARQDRKNAFRKFIMANNLLNVFGIPSLSSFEEKISKDSEFRNQLANNPEFSDFVAQNYEGTSPLNEPRSEESGSVMDRTMTLGVLKMLAKYM
jgi:hypothetical protein